MGYQTPGIWKRDYGIRKYGIRITEYGTEQGLPDMEHVRNMKNGVLTSEKE